MYVCETRLPGFMVSYSYQVKFIAALWMKNQTANDKQEISTKTLGEKNTLQFYVYNEITVITMTT